MLVEYTKNSTFHIKKIQGVEMIKPQNIFNKSKELADLTNIL